MQDKTSRILDSEIMSGDDLVRALGLNGANKVANQIAHQRERESEYENTRAVHAHVARQGGGAKERARRVKQKA